MSAAPAQPSGVHASRKAIAPFRLERPRSIAETLALMRKHRGDHALMAGGVDVIAALKGGLRVGVVIALADVAELRTVARRGDEVSIGAALTHRALAEHPVLKAAAPALCAYVADLGNIRIRCQGSIGGNILAMQPNYEMLAALMALDATLVFATPEGAVVELPARAVTKDALAALGEALLVSIRAPVSGVDLAWSRALRPYFGVILAVDRRSGRAIVSAALSGAHAVPYCGLVHADDDQAFDPRAIAEGCAAWARHMPAPDVAGALSAAWHRRAAAVVLQRVAMGSLR